MINYTKGKWRTDKFKDRIEVVSPLEEVVICRVYDEANAQLIASAPDLYEALKALASVCRDVSYTHSELNKARKALAKVEGK